MRRGSQIAGDSGDSAPTLGATAATMTTAASSARSAPPQPPASKIGAEFLHNSAGPESAVGFERCQTALVCRHRSPLFWRHRRPAFRSDHRQKGLRPHCQREVPIPARPTADFVVVQADLTFGGLDAFFHGPAQPSNAHLLSQCLLGWCKGSHTLSPQSDHCSCAGPPTSVSSPLAPEHAAPRGPNHTSAALCCLCQH